jgi:y4mF family transcriptional regulator
VYSEVVGERDLPKSKRSETPEWAATLGAAVRERRRALGLTQQELADTAGCSRLLIVEIEGGKPTARLDRLVTVLQTIGLQLRFENGDGGIVA